jgi:hypothetical protein
MGFADFLFMIPTKAACLRVYLTSDVFYCLWQGETGQSEEGIVEANLPFLREIAANKIVADGFRPGMVTITAIDIEP